MISRILLACIASAIVLVGEAYGNCASTMQLSCGVYNTCFERYCPCENTSHGYFIRYGKKYCERFIASTGWSEKGNRWRDRTLLCLQEKIVPRLSISDPPFCDCRAMKDFAFQTHVQCYTQPGSSVCELELSDYRKIYDIIDIGADVLGDAYGKRQLREVLQICQQSQNSTLPAGALDWVIRILEKLR